MAADRISLVLPPSFCLGLWGRIFPVACGWWTICLHRTSPPTSSQEIIVLYVGFDWLFLNLGCVFDDHSLILNPVVQSYVVTACYPLKRRYMDGQGANMSSIVLSHFHFRPRNHIIVRIPTPPTLSHTEVKFKSQNCIGDKNRMSPH